MKQVNLLSRTALLCLLISNSVLALTATPRLCRLMCGIPTDVGTAFRLAPASDGEAEPLSVESVGRTSPLPQTDPTIEQFWSKFKTAVQKSDKASVATLSQFPISMPYGYAKIRNRTQLSQRWRDLFTAQAKAVKCFEEAKPVIDPENKNRFTVGCKNEAGDEVVIYGFTKTRAGWKLAYLDNINE